MQLFQQLPSKLHYFYELYCNKHRINLQHKLFIREIIFIFMFYAVLLHIITF